MDKLIAYLKEKCRGSWEWRLNINEISEDLKMNPGEVKRTLNVLARMDVIEIVTYKGKTSVKWLGTHEAG